MKLKFKLILGYLSIATLTSIVGLIGYGNVQVINEDFKIVAERTLPTTAALKDLNIAGLRIISATGEYIMISARTKNLPQTKQIKAALVEEEEEVKEEGILVYD